MSRLSTRTALTIARGAPGPKKGRYGEGVRRVTDPEAAYSLAPVVLRRADILGFWSLPTAQRKLVFFDFFRPPSLDEAKRLDAGRVAAKAGDEIDVLRNELVAAKRRLGADGDPRDSPAALRRQMNYFRRDVIAPKFTRVVKAKGGANRKTVDPTINRAAQDLFDVMQELERHERTRRLNLDRAQGTIPRRVEAEVEAILAEAGEAVTESFTAISDNDFVRRTPTESSPSQNGLEDCSRLGKWGTRRPVAVLSEANLDLLALLVFCGIVEAAADHGQAKFLIFDDVFQSVDAVYRERACRYLAERFRDWQLFFTDHDRLWFSILGDTLRPVGVPYLPREIVRWSFEDGPMIRDAVLDPDGPLRRAMVHAEPWPFAPALVCSWRRSRIG